MRPSVETLRQIGQFGIVGGLATLTHSAVFALAAASGIDPDWANLLAFCCALPVSYYGNARLTFQVRPDGRRLRRFLVTALTGFALNAANVHLVSRAGLPWSAALPGMVLIVPLLSFGLSKLWVYRTE